MHLRNSILTWAKILALSCALAPLPALAGPDVAAQVTRQLSAQGYRQIESRRTLLGKVVVTARGNGHLREIVIDPRNGALLRDLVREDEGDRDGASIARVGDRRGGDDPDDDDKDGGDDNSGSGSSGDDDDDNSGSGSRSDDDDDDDDDSSGSGSGGDDDDSDSGDNDSESDDGPDRDDD